MNCPDHGDDESPWGCYCTGKKIDKLEANLAAVTKERNELRELVRRLVYDHDAGNAVPEAVQAALWDQAAALLAAMDAQHEQP